MGRSVMTISDATAVAYQTFGPDEDYYRQGFHEAVEEGHLDPEDDFEDWLYGPYGAWDSDADWDDLIYSLTERAEEVLGMEEWDEYIGDEVRVIAQNEHSILTVSEYEGMVAICLAPKYDRRDYWAEPEGPEADAGREWRERNAEEFLRMFGEYEKIGTFSNGESVYRKAVQ